MSSTPFFQPDAFAGHPEVVAVHSLRDPAQDGGFSVLPIGASEEQAARNRAALAQQLGFSIDHLAAPKLVQGSDVMELADSYTFDHRLQADAIITNKPGWLIGVGVADCVAILIYDPSHHAVGAVHSGWRGTKANIATNAVKAMANRYGSHPTELVAWLSPAPLRFEYGLLKDYSSGFAEKYRSPKSAGDEWLDNKLAVYDQLLAAGLKPEYLHVDPRSSYPPEFHSFRRDGDKSGRHLVGIGIKA